VPYGQTDGLSGLAGVEPASHRRLGRWKPVVVAGNLQTVDMERALAQVRERTSRLAG